VNILCWLIDHEWKRNLAPSYGRIRCRRCRAEPYDNVTLPEWWLNTVRFGRIAKFVRRVPIWFRSRPCWVKGHDWSPYSDRCRRCKQTGTAVAESGEWSLQEWKKLWRPWLSDRFGLVPQPDVHVVSRGKCFAVRAFNWRLGVERSTLAIKGEPYMTRYIAYLGPINLRLHKFYRGDDDRASHTHPWAFVTFPFAHYCESIFEKGKWVRHQAVRAFRFHHRALGFEHIVVSRIAISKGGAWTYSKAPFWTFVITGPHTEDWGFYPKPGKFVHWRAYK
jgi:hypothetical protein